MTKPQNAGDALKPNPTLKIVDIKAVSDLSAYFQRPLELGADMTFYSLTKYMNGHSDVIMGAVSTNNTDLAERLRWIQNAAGAVPSPFDCYLVNRSLKTLHVRMGQ